MRQNINFGKLLHGGDYNPEQWLEYPEILEQDLAYFKKAKINEVSLGIFSWAFLEPEEGVFDLEWLKKMVDRLYENGISVMMATPTAARPRWMWRTKRTPCTFPSRNTIKTSTIPANSRARSSGWRIRRSGRIRSAETSSRTFRRTR